jgi:hypothetical protein
MKTIRNKTLKPIRVPLPGGKTLHLGPTGTGQVSDKAVERDALKKLIKDGSIEVLDGTEPAQATGSGSPSLHGSTHGHPRPGVVKPKGDR